MERDILKLKPALAARIQTGKLLHRTTAYALKLHDGWFAGFGDAGRVKVKPALCDARMIPGSNRQKVDDYVTRLAECGHAAEVHTVTANLEKA